MKDVRTCTLLDRLPVNRNGELEQTTWTQTLLNTEAEDWLLGLVTESEGKWVADVLSLRGRGLISTGHQGLVWDSDSDARRFLCLPGLLGAAQPPLAKQRKSWTNCRICGNPVWLTVEMDPLALLMTPAFSGKMGKCLRQGQLSKDKSVKFLKTTPQGCFH